jgi:hypothetical protein
MILTRRRILNILKLAHCDKKIKLHRGAFSTRNKPIGLKKIHQLGFYFYKTGNT